MATSLIEIQPTDPNTTYDTDRKFKSLTRWVYFYHQTLSVLGSINLNRNLDGQLTRSPAWLPVLRRANACKLLRADQESAYLADVVFPRWHWRAESR